MQPGLNNKLNTTRGAYLPYTLRTALEAISGYDMADVRVHYNSDRPAQINALAFAYGSAIYLAPGQERCLPHEAWHVVQQKQGRVKPTTWLTNGIALNEDAGLETEADTVADCLLAPISAPVTYAGNKPPVLNKRALRQGVIKQPVLQRVGLESLLRPKINQLTAGVIPVQNKLIQELNKKIAQLPETDPSRAVTHICSLILVNNEGNYVFDLVEPITPDGLKSGSYIPVNYNLIKDEYFLKEYVKTVVNATLIQSGQLEYLLNNNLPDNEWQIYIDFHYYYTRPNEAAGFHRDSIGHTLFVNLNYNNQNDFKGAEFLIDLDKYEDHDLYIASKLPPVFLADIKDVKDKGYEGPDIIDFGDMRPNGIISWADELVDHSTPYLGHRGITGDDFKRFIGDYYAPTYKNLQDIVGLSDHSKEPFDKNKLKEVLKDDYFVNDIMSRYTTITGETVNQYINEVLFKTLFAPELVNSLAQRYKLIQDNTGEGAKVINDDELMNICLNNQHLFDAIKNYINKPNMKDLGIKYIKDGALSDTIPPYPIKEVSQRTRRMSISLQQSGVASFPPGEKRQFIRTWVQARKKPQS